jgi:hypothetical protein
MERAKLAGVNEYQLKLDKEKLLDSINALISVKRRQKENRSRSTV